MFLVLLVRDCLFQAILDVMPCSPAIHARSEFDLCHICGRTLAFCGICSRVYARQTLRIGALRCLLSTCQTGVHPATRCASASLHIRSVSGCPETIPKVCPIRVLVLLGSVRPCSLPPVRILSCKTQKKKKKKRHLALICMGISLCPWAPRLILSFDLSALGQISGKFGLVSGCVRELRRPTWT